MEHADVVVIGGGLLGSATAYYLSRGGATVAVVEKGQLNRQASGQNAGSLHFQLEYRMVEHGTALANQFARAFPLHLDAARAWGGVERELDTDLQLHQDGGFMVAETPAETEVLQRKQALERRWGLETDLLTGDEARALAPYLSEEVRAASYCRQEGHVNSRLVGPAFARAAMRGGASVRVETRVVGLSRAAGCWQVALDGGLGLRAGAVLITAGVWSGQVAAMADVRLPVIPIALGMIVTAATRPMIPHLIQHVGRRLSMKQAHDGNVLIGGGWPAKLVQSGGAIDLDAKPELRFESLAGSAWTAARIAPSVGALSVIRAWSGITAITTDHVPLLGEISRRPGLFIATGGSAFTLGPTFARQMSELILTGRPSLSLDAYSPRRFAHLNFV